IEASWMVSDANNTREVEVRITVTDPDGDQITGRSILYYGEDYNNTADWSSLSASGAIITNIFEINQTISTGILRLEANDTSNPDEIDTIDLSFSVGLSGVEQGDCITSSIVDDDLSEEEIEELEFQQNNTITNSIDDLKGALNLNLTNQIIWLIIMAVVGGILAYAGFANHSNPQVVLSVSKDSLK
ncbi:unnamed protein product, partial [marine sediment metagenome]